jgi:uncharacterized lipoprotein YmbA
MMRWMTTLIVTLTLTACVGSSPPSRFYELTAIEGPAGTARSDVVVSVGPVRLPALLDRPQLVMRIGEHERAVMEFARWAEPLSESVPRVLAENIGRQLGSDRVGVSVVGATEPPDYVVTVTVTRFDATVGGNAVLTCRWELLDGARKGLMAGTARHSATPQSADESDIVAALNAILGDLSGAIADAINAQG